MVQHFADTCTCTNTSWRSFDTTSNTSESVIFILKVLIICNERFRALLYFYGELVHTSIVSIASAMFATVFPTPEMIVMNINEWRIRSCRLQNSQLPMRTWAILCFAISVVFSDDTDVNLNEKIKKKKIKKNTFTVGQDKTVGRTRTSKQFCWGALY